MMNFLKCVFCYSGPVRIFDISPSTGMAKSKCGNCGLCSPNEYEKKDSIKKPEIIYR